jgi:hypothetical protein
VIGAIRPSIRNALRGEDLSQWASTAPAAASPRIPHCQRRSNFDPLAAAEF